MARPSWSNFRWLERHMRPLCACLLTGIFLAASGCANLDGRPLFERSAAERTGPTGSYLAALRDYLAQPPQQRQEQRERLRQNAQRGGRAEQLEYALALSTHLDEPAALELAREQFETLLAAPEPLPVALDGLVRLQMASVINRLDGLAELDALHDAAQSCALEQRQCQVALMSAENENEAQQEELEILQRKLAALTRIEQTVNDGPDERNSRRPDETARNDPENSHATVPPDPAR